MCDCKSKLARHFDIKDEDATKWSPICKSFWSTYFFLTGLIFVIILGACVPSIGHKKGPLHPPITSSWVAVCVIFLITGLGVKTAELKKATLFWQLNLFVHFFIYVYHPCIGFAVVSFIRAVSNISSYILDGLMITLCLPTTISSAVVLTVNASGNEAAAVVNTALANMLGIIVTPALIYVFLGSFGTVDIGNVFYKLSLRVIVPFGAGQIIRNAGGERARKFIKQIKPILKKVSETLLLFIIFCAISESFYTGLDADYIDIIVVSAIVFCIHCSSLVLVWYLSGVRSTSMHPIESHSSNSPLNDRVVNSDDNETNDTRKKCKCQCACSNCLQFDMYDRIAILFCATQKTAAFGIPLVSSLFETSEQLGIYLVPLLIYHPMQLIIDSLLVQPLSLKVSKYEQSIAVQIQNEDEDGNFKNAVHVQENQNGSAVPHKDEEQQMSVELLEES